MCALCLLPTHLCAPQDTKDNHEEAANAAPLAMRLCYMIEEAGGCWEEHADALIDAFTADTGRRATYSVCCY